MCARRLLGECLRHALHCKESRLHSAKFLSFYFCGPHTFPSECYSQQGTPASSGTWFLKDSCHSFFSLIMFNGNTFISFICPFSYLISVQTKKKINLRSHSVYSSAAVQHCFALTFLLAADLPLVCDFVQPASCTSCTPQRPRNPLKYAQRWLRRAPPPTRRALQNRP